MQILLAAVVAAFWLFFSGALVFAAALPRWFQLHFGHIARDPKEPSRVWLIAVEKLMQGFGLAFLVGWSTQVISHLAIIPVLLVSCTYLFSTFTTFRVSSWPVIAIAAIDAVRLIIALVFAGLILQRGIF